MQPHAFAPEGADVSKKLTVGTTTANVAVRTTRNSSRHLKIENLGPNKCFVETGPAAVAAAVDTGVCIRSGQTLILTSGELRVAAICDAAESAVLYITPGEGGV